MFSQKKPYTAVTVTIERLTSESYEEDDLSGIPDLVEVIKIQSSGPTEAARAIRKKLKYGNTHRQLRALTLLDGLIQNAGPSFQRTFADEPLLERLRVAGTSGLSDPAVRKKCRDLFAGWAQYKSTPGMERVSRLHKELPYRKVAPTQERSKVIRETENPFGPEEEEQNAAASSSKPAVPYGQTSGTVTSFSTTAGSSSNTHRKGSSSGSVGFFSSHSKDKDKDKKRKVVTKHKPFNLEEEKEQMKATIADSSIATTNLMNALQSINREKERISENKVAVELFEMCKQLRRRVFRYIHHVEDEQWLGSLLNANDQLVLALMTFEQLDRSIDADSDSEDELAEQAHQYRMAQIKAKEKEAAGPGSPGSPRSPTSASPPQQEMLGLSLSGSPRRPGLPPPRPSALLKPSSASTDEAGPRLPPRPSAMTSSRVITDPDGLSTASEDEDDEDENDPFADRNAVPTPLVDRGDWAR